jgi:Flp pilus assembly protein TadD
MEPRESPTKLALRAAISSLNRGDLDDAVARFSDAIALDPQCHEGYSGLGVARARRREYDLAADAFGECAKLRPSDPQSRYNYAVALQRAGRYEDAAAEYLRVLRLQPEHLPAQRALRRLVLAGVVSTVELRCPRCGSRPELPQLITCRHCGAGFQVLPVASAEE